MTFGIDLGTTNSCVARIDDAGRASIVKSALGEDTTPSVVYFESERHAVVGRSAKNEALLAPDLVAQLVKREMGADRQYTFHGEQHTPETVSALILRELASAAEENTGQVVRDVVITVPAYFGVAEREATRRAGQLAGLNVIDVLAEPVAAVLHYRAVTAAAGTVRHVLVYDLGGGTFDTTVIRLAGDDVTVVCTDGDKHLGGADWDRLIAEYLLDRFTEEHPGLRPQDDPLFMQDLMIAVERLKEDLSDAQVRRHIMRFGGAVTRVELTRDKLEELTAELLDRTVAVTERTIETARREGAAALDDVLLVGGMTRTPAITRILRERLGLTARHHEPDLAVAKGAALYALMRTVRPSGAASGDGAAAAQNGAASALKTPEQVAADTGMPVDEVNRLARARVATVVPRGFGVRSLDGNDPLALTDPLRAHHIVVHLLPANTPLPNDTGPFTFHTAQANQRIVGIEVWEQAGEVESEELAENRKIGNGMLRHLPARLPQGTPIEVTFFMSETGLLAVRAVQPESGAELQFELQIGDLDKAKMDKARRSIAAYRVSR
jgi:molecular chaperone DnaK (HSP70)